jgi:hypothetical protein
MKPLPPVCGPQASRFRRLWNRSLDGFSTSIRSAPTPPILRASSTISWCCAAPCALTSRTSGRSLRKSNPSSLRSIPTISRLGLTRSVATPSPTPIQAAIRLSDSSDERPARWSGTFPTPASSTGPGETSWPSRPTTRVHDAAQLAADCRSRRDTVADRPSNLREPSACRIAAYSRLVTLGGCRQQAAGRRVGSVADQRRRGRGVRSPLLRHWRRLCCTRASPTQQAIHS